MKKLTVILIALMLTLCCAPALAERLEISLDTTAFTLAFEKPDGASITLDTREPEFIFLEMYFDDDPSCAYYLMVSPFETYAAQSMAELSDSDLTEYQSAYIQDMDAPVTEWLTDSAGRKWLFVDENGSSYDGAEAGTIFRGYSISVSAFNEDFSELSASQTDRIKALVESVITTEM
ncbi:MAG: hypothetical protein PHI27_03820 [Eubacteriales bacterium]|nr:hypothetical protein [Eubacteriales bacterium]MDD3881362.1 hypothetical protein [Eubacteriales bacterium]MDD4513049.1 hypothetical protein [Eubacteriales bacterium]